MRTEFEFIKEIKFRYNLSKVGDDCSILPKDNETDLLITSDMLVEGIDFQLEWATPEQIGHKALAISLSDIAAMGGTPTYAMLSIALVENLWKGDFLDRLYAGWHNVAYRFGTELVGGDVSRTSGPLTIDSTVLGVVPKGSAILRSGARLGEGIYVTGTLGGAAGGLQLLLEQRRFNCPGMTDLRQKQLEPLPQLAIVKPLQQNGLASAAIDLSDGLTSDLMHLCKGSGVGAKIYTWRLPIEPALRSFFSPQQCLDMALNGGEDFQLLFSADEKALSSSGITGITLIGHITEDTGVIELVDGTGSSPVEPKGYRHF